MARFLWSVVCVTFVTFLWLMTSVPAAPTRVAQNRDNFSSETNTTESLLTSANAGTEVRHDSRNETGVSETAVDDGKSTFVTTQSGVTSSALSDTKSSDVKEVTSQYEPTTQSWRKTTSLSTSNKQVTTHTNNSSDETLQHSKNYTWSEIYAQAFGRDKDQSDESDRNMSKNAAHSQSGLDNTTSSHEPEANRSGEGHTNSSEISSVTQENITEPKKQTLHKKLSSDNSSTTTNTTEGSTPKTAITGGAHSPHGHARTETPVQEETELNLRVLEAAKNVSNNASSHEGANLNDVISSLGDVTAPVNVTGATTDNATANATSRGTFQNLPGSEHLGLLVKHLTGFVHHVWVGQPSSKTPGPSNEDLMDDGPFGSVLMREQKYLISVLIPIGVGITGAMLIIIMAYATRMCGRRDQQEDSQPRMIYNPGMRRRSPDRYPLQESSDEEF